MDGHWTHFFLSLVLKTQLNYLESKRLSQTVRVAELLMVEGSATIFVVIRTVYNIWGLIGIFGLFSPN